MRRPPCPVSFALLLALAAATAARAQEGEPKKDEGRGPLRDAPGTYMGRPIAQTMSFLGAEWLFRPEREQEEQPDRMLDALKIRPGMTVADIGAGAGYTSLRLARRVGPKGTVLATDVQKEMLDLLRQNARAAGVRNIKPTLSTQQKTGLPDGRVDLAIMVDVYHEVDDPEAMLRGIRRALKPGGRLVLVEYRGEDPTVPIKPEHKMTAAQVRKEVEPQGFAFKERHDFLPWQHILIFEKPADAAPDAAGAGDDAGPAGTPPRR